MRISADDHPLSIFQGDRGVKGSALEVMRSLTVFLEERFSVFNSLLKEIVFIFLFDKEKGFPSLNDGKRGRNQDGLEHGGRE